MQTCLSIPNFFPLVKFPFGFDKYNENHSLRTHNLNHKRKDFSYNRKRRTFSRPLLWSFHTTMQIALVQCQIWRYFVNLYQWPLLFNILNRSLVKFDFVFQMFEKNRNNSILKCNCHWTFIRIVPCSTLISTNLSCILSVAYTTLFMQQCNAIHWVY